VKALSSRIGRGTAIAAALSLAVLGGSVIASRTFVSGGAGPELDLAPPARALAPGLVRLDAPKGRELLFESEAHAAFLPLITHFETQKSLAHCGPASMAMVLNALEVPAPTAAPYGTYRLFTQDNLLNELTDAIISDRTVARRGMSLANVARVLRVYAVAVDLRYAGASSTDEFRSLAAAYLARADHHVIVNYSRTALGQEGGGHISPLGAYDADSDRFLILDVSRYKAPAVWVSTEQLFQAMAQPLEPDNPRTRGFLLIRAPLSPDNAATPVASPPT
jgi:hypothetical protein